MKKILLSMTAFLFCFSIPSSYASIVHGKLVKVEHETYEGCIEDQCYDLFNTLYEPQEVDALEVPLSVRFEKAIVVEGSSVLGTDEQKVRYTVSVDLGEGKIHREVFNKLSNAQMFWKSQDINDRVPFEYWTVEKDLKQPHENFSNMYKVGSLQIGRYEGREIFKINVKLGAVEEYDRGPAAWE